MNDILNHENIELPQGTKRVNKEKRLLSSSVCLGLRSPADLSGLMHVVERVLYTPVSTVQM